MSHFYGTVQGSRGGVSRCGTKKSTMVTHCASWEGCVVSQAYFNKETGTDWVLVSLTTWQGQGQFPTKVLYHGPIGKYQPERAFEPNG